MAGGLTHAGSSGAPLPLLELRSENAGTILRFLW